MEVGVEIWIKDQVGHQAWVPGTVIFKESLEKGLLKLIVANENGEEYSYQ